MVARRPDLRAVPSFASAALRRGALTGAVALIGLCAAAPEASAQFGFYTSHDFYDEVPLIAPRALAYRLQSRGFTDLTRPRFDGTAYVVDATNPAGARVRLFVDAQDGAIIGRRPLDVPYYPSAREGRSAPGYGWTEEDVERRRSGRAAEGLVPPADIPNAVAPRPSRQAALGAEVSPRAGASDVNPLGTNPDGKGRTGAPSNAPSKKTARLNPPQKPAVVGAAPAAPAPKIDAAETAKPETAKSEPTKFETTEPKAAAAIAPTVGPAKPEPAAMTPAASQESSERAAAEAIKAATSKQDNKPDQAKQDAAKQDQGWRDPTPDESKRKVRVIDGATVVPGSGENQASTN